MRLISKNENMKKDRQGKRKLKYPKAIVNWPEDERPRERLIKLGADKLSDIRAVNHSQAKMM